jgi:hypothetical protein
LDLNWVLVKTLELFPLPCAIGLTLYSFGSLRILGKQDQRYEDLGIGKKKGCFKKNILFCMMILYGKIICFKYTFVWNYCVSIDLFVELCVCWKNGFILCLQICIIFKKKINIYHLVTILEMNSIVKFWFFTFSCF